MLQSLEQTLDEFLPEHPEMYVDNWYRVASVAQYDSHAAAAAYLGAYGPRSILKCQEAFLALLFLKGSIDEQTVVVDYGSGPCIGLAALTDLLSVLSSSMRRRLSLEYVAVDRSPSMLEVGRAFGRRIVSNAPIPITWTETTPEGLRTRPSARLVLISNVMNEGEGNTDCRAFLTSLLAEWASVNDVVVIEPGTEGPSRQMCGLGSGTGFIRIGPCPHPGNSCTVWSVRTFPKRVYAIERKCLGRWSPAAATCKYALALLSRSVPARDLGPDGRIVVASRSSRGDSLSCRYGQTQWQRIEEDAVPWDLITSSGKVQEWWP